MERDRTRIPYTKRNSACACFWEQILGLGAMISAADVSTRDRRFDESSVAGGRRRGMEAETCKHTVGRAHRHHASGKCARTREGSGAGVAMGRAVGVVSAG